MAFSKEVYKLLEEIVGAENISDDPALLDSYAFQYLAETIRPEQSPFMPRPVAALMPRTTNEVQQIVKTCNRYKVKVKPYSTGWYMFGAPQLEGVDNTIQLDLRRMDSINIDEKNMFAIVEPYAICARLQAEAMKVGLNCNIIGAGASTSPLASSTSYQGGGPGTPWLGQNSENLLGFEWVMPNGEILRSGSLGSDCGWFCGEGPGPSVRAIMKGIRGSRGGMGVFTKVAIKLTHWPGPKQLDVQGTVPAYHVEIPSNFRAYTLAFPSWPAYAEAYYKLYDNEIGYITHRQFNMLGEDIGPAFWILYLDPTKTLNDLEEFVKKPEIKKLTEELRISFQIIMAGNSQRDIEFQDRVIDKILSETGGWKVARMAEKDMTDFTYLYMLRLGHKPLNFVYTGGYMGSWSQGGTPDYVIDYIPVLREGGYRDQESGLIVQCGGDASMGGLGFSGGGGSFALEQFVHYDQADRESIKTTIKHMHDAKRDAVAHGFPPGKENLYLQVGLTYEQLHQEFASSKQPIPYYLQGKIKKLLDPNDIGDRMYSYLLDDDTKQV